MTASRSRLQSPQDPIRDRFPGPRQYGLKVYEAFKPHLGARPVCSNPNDYAKREDERWGVCVGLWLPRFAWDVRGWDHRA